MLLLALKSIDGAKQEHEEQCRNATGVLSGPLFCTRLMRSIFIPQTVQSMIEERIKKITQTLTKWYYVDGYEYWDERWWLSQVCTG